jgi:hypothetical protein
MANRAGNVNQRITPICRHCHGPSSPENQTPRSVPGYSRRRSPCARRSNARRHLWLPAGHYRVRETGAMRGCPWIAPELRSRTPRPRKDRGERAAGAPFSAARRKLRSPLYRGENPGEICATKVRESRPHRHASGVRSPQRPTAPAFNFGIRVIDFHGKSPSQPGKQLRGRVLGVIFGLSRAIGSGMILVRDDAARNRRPIAH